MQQPGVVLVHRDEVPLLEVVGVAVVARQSNFGLLNIVLSTGVAAQRLQQSWSRHVHSDHGPMRLWVRSESCATAERYLCSATGVESEYVQTRV